MLPVYRAMSAVIDFIITVVTALLGLRVLLHLFGANDANGFVRAVYTLSEPLLAPFSGIFPALELESGFILEFATLFALIVYAILAHLLMTFVRALAYSSFRRRIALRHQQRSA